MPIGTCSVGEKPPDVTVPIGMGYVASDYAAVGTALEIDVRGKRLNATVTAMPFVPHRYHRKGKA